MVLSMKVQEYLREDGSSPYQEWFDTLDIYAATKVSTAIVRLELGNTSNIKWFDGIGELKIDYGSGYRIYLVQQGQELIILFGGGTKKHNNQILRMLKIYIKNTNTEKNKF